MKPYPQTNYREFKGLCQSLWIGRGFLRSVRGICPDKCREQGQRRGMTSRESWELQRFPGLSGGSPGRVERGSYAGCN